MSCSPGTQTLSKRWVVRSRAWIAVLIILPFAILAAVSEPLPQFNEVERLGLQLIGWALFLLGALCRWWATLYIGGQKGALLVCDGPYSLSRNPLYLGTFLIAMSIAVLISSVAFGIGVVVASVFYLTVTVRAEERRLQAQFGDAFLNYRERVPVFFPNSFRYQSPEQIQVQINGLHAEFLRCLRWCWVPLLCTIFTQLRLQDWWPQYFRLP